MSASLRPTMVLSSLERTAVGLVIGVLCSAGLAVAGWWSSAAVTVCGVWPLSEASIAAAAFTGLGLGLMLDVVFLRRWVAGFYTWDGRLLAVLYLVGSAVAVAWFMGLPQGNALWGSLAEAYVGRRLRHQRLGRAAFRQAAYRVGFFTAAVTGVEALPIGLLSLQEGIVIDGLRTIVGWTDHEIAAAPGVTLVVLLCLLLMVIQMGLTWAAATSAFEYGSRNRHGLDEGKERR